MADMKIDIRSDVHTAPDDLRGVNRALDVMEDKAEAAGRKLKALGEKAERIGKKMSLMVTLPILAAGGAAIKMAMDAEESRNLFEVSMGDMVDIADKWSADLSENLGINRFESQKLIGTFNVMLKSMGHNEKAAYDMSKGMAELTYDMASFYNLEAEDAFLKIQAGITGEIEPLKRLGIIIKDVTIKQWAMDNGMIKQGEQMTENQKVIARYNVIMEQTALAQGDLARTLDSPTNKLRILKSRVAETAITFGMKMMPAFESFLKLAEKGVKWFSSLSDASMVMVIKVAAVAASIGPFLIMLGKIIKIAPHVGKAVKVMTGPFGIVTTAILAAGAAIDYFIKKSIELSDKEIAAMTEYGSAAGEYHAMRTKMIGDEIVTVEEWREIYNKHGRSVERVMKAISTLPEYEEIRNRWNEVQESIGEDTEAIGGHFKRLPEYLSESTIAFEAWAAKISGYAFPTIEESLKKLEDPYEEMEDTSNEFAASLITDATKVETSLKGILAHSEKNTKAWKTEQLKELSGFEQGIVSVMNVYEQGMEGILQAAKRWAIAEAVKYIMSRPLLFPIKLALAAGAILTISGLYSTIASLQEGGIVPSPQMVEAGHGPRGEAIIPLEKLPGIVKEITRETTIRETGGGIIQLQVYLGDELIGEKIIDIVQEKAEKGEIEFPVKVLL
ncbi:MAG: hypothetical protein KAR42_16710 [candidate division Zixibacteria bacterium]|nr:hypothetical protein [candidate division Zixibacteria bacterium]